MNPAQRNAAICHVTGALPQELPGLLCCKDFIMSESGALVHGGAGVVYLCWLSAPVIPVWINAQKTLSDTNRPRGRSCEPPWERTPSCRRSRGGSGCSAAPEVSEARCWSLIKCKFMDSSSSSLLPHQLSSFDSFFSG